MTVTDMEFAITQDTRVGEHERRRESNMGTDEFEQSGEGGGRRREQESVRIVGGICKWASGRREPCRLMGKTKTENHPSAGVGQT